VSSTLVAAIVLLAAYALLPERYRFSRAIILFGALLAFLLISMFRWILIKTRVLEKNDDKEDKPATIIVASPEEYKKTIQLMEEAGLKERVLGRVAVSEDDTTGIGNWKKIEMLSAIIPFREIIFCEGTLSFNNIIESVQSLQKHIAIKFHASNSQSIVGSSSKDTSGEFVSKENGFKLKNPYSRRLKRLIDVIIAVTGLITFPVHLVAVKKPFTFFAKCFAVLFAQKTWIGYAAVEKNLPHLRKAVITCNGIPASVKQQLPAESLQMVDYWYARDYTPATDLKLIKAAYRNLGN
jgi:O-antigen biosynthesis protein